MHIYWNNNLDPLDMIIEARTLFGHSIFRELMITACWIIWRTRNAIIFDHGNYSLSNWKRMFKEKLSLVCIKAKPEKRAQLMLWRDNYS